MSTPLRSVALITGPDTYLDHLGVICAIMQMPLIVTEQKTFEAAQTFYPQIEVIQMDYTELSLDFLATHFDVIFESGKFWSAEMAPLFKLLYGKEMRFVFCPHGNSDKGFSLKTHIHQDISLVYGDHMMQLLEKTGALKQTRSTLTTGNYRYPFYRKHKEFYDKLVEERVFRFFARRKKTILYAPTWNDKETPSSFFSSCKQLIEQLSSTFNLIIKLHPFLEEYHPAETHHILSQYENYPSLIFLSHFPAIYSLLAHSDIYIGDFSSIGYDFLAFGKPMYFFNPLSKNPENEQGYFLHRCGLEIPPSEKNRLCEFILQTLDVNTKNYSLMRKQIYEFAFGKEKDPAVLRQEILHLCSKALVF